jgi:hypothetical protein
MKGVDGIIGRSSSMTRAIMRVMDMPIRIMVWIPKGCAVVLRPDQYVSFVTEVDDYEGLGHFFSGFMTEQKQQNGSIGKVPEAIGKGTIVERDSVRNGMHSCVSLLKPVDWCRSSFIFSVSVAIFLMCL